MERRVHTLYSRWPISFRVASGEWQVAHGANTIPTRISKLKVHSKCTSILFIDSIENECKRIATERIHLPKHVHESHGTHQTETMMGAQTASHTAYGRAQRYTRARKHTHRAFSTHSDCVLSDAQGHFNCHILLHRELSSSIDTRATVCFW